MEGKCGFWTPTRQITLYGMEKSGVGRETSRVSEREVRILEGFIYTWNFITDVNNHTLKMHLDVWNPTVKEEFLQQIRHFSAFFP